MLLPLRGASALSALIALTLPLLDGALSSTQSQGTKTQQCTVNCGQTANTTTTPPALRNPVPDYAALIAAIHPGAGGAPLDPATTNDGFGGPYLQKVAENSCTNCRTLVGQNLFVANSGGSGSPAAGAGSGGSSGTGGTTNGNGGGNNAGTGSGGTGGGGTTGGSGTGNGGSGNTDPTSPPIVDPPVPPPSGTDTGGNPPGTGTGDNPPGTDPSGNPPGTGTGDNPPGTGPGGNPGGGSSNDPPPADVPEPASLLLLLAGLALFGATRRKV